MGDLAYIETHPSDQKFELCLAFIVVVSVLILFDERITRNEFCVAELQICSPVFCLEVEFFMTLKRIVFRLFHCVLDFIHSLN